MSNTLSQNITIAKQNNLEGLDILWRFNYTELEKIYNGIGPDRFPKILRDIITEANGLFEPAALIHDIRYHVGGDYDDFTKANLEFGKNCITLVKAAYSWYDPRRYYWWLKAIRFTGYCQAGGWKGYTKKSGEPE